MSLNTINLIEEETFYLLLKRINKKKNFYCI